MCASDSTSVAFKAAARAGLPTRDHVAVKPVTLVPACPGPPESWCTLPRTSTTTVSISGVACPTTCMYPGPVFTEGRAFPETTTTSADGVTEQPSVTVSLSAYVPAMSTANVKNCTSTTVPAQALPAGVAVNRHS